MATIAVAKIGATLKINGVEYPIYEGDIVNNLVYMDSSPAVPCGKLNHALVNPTKNFAAALVKLLESACSILYEGDIVNNLVYMDNGVEKTITGAIRVISASTAAQRVKVVRNAVQLVDHGTDSIVGDRRILEFTEDFVILLNSWGRIPSCSFYCNITIMTVRLHRHQGIFLIKNRIRKVVMFHGNYRRQNHQPHRQR